MYFVEDGVWSIFSGCFRYLLGCEVFVLEGWGVYLEVVDDCDV